MNDMSPVIVPKSDQLNADSLIAGPITIKITAVDIRPGTEQPVSIFYEGDDGNPWKPCKSMARVMVAVWGADSKNYIGRGLTLYRDPSVKWGGVEVGGIRISHMTHMEGPMTMALTATKGSRKPYTVRPLEGPASALTMDGARQSLLDAADLDELRTAWSRKTMAPFRDQLEDLLAERKLALAEAMTEQGRTDEQHGYQGVGVEDAEDDDLPVWHAMVEGWKLRIEQAPNINVIIGVRKEFQDKRMGLPDDVVAEIDLALDTATAKFTNPQKEN